MRGTFSGPARRPACPPRHAVHIHDELCRARRRTGAEQIDYADQTLGPRQPARMPGIPAADTDGTARLQQSPGAQSWQSAQAGAVGYDLLKTPGGRKILDPAGGVEETAQAADAPCVVLVVRIAKHEYVIDVISQGLQKVRDGNAEPCPGGRKDHEQTSGAASAREIGGVFAPRLSDVGGGSLPTLQQRRDGERQVPVALQQLGDL